MWAINQTPHSFVLEYTLHPFFCVVYFSRCFVAIWTNSFQLDTVLGQMAELWFVRLNKKHVALFVGFIYTCCTLFSNSLTFQKHNCLWGKNHKGRILCEIINVRILKHFIICLAVHKWVILLNCLGIIFDSMMRVSPADLLSVFIRVNQIGRGFTWMKVHIE